MLDRSKIGLEFQPFETEVEKGRLRFFAKAIGETGPVYSDERAAVAAGYDGVPAPPTFPFSLDLDGPDLLPVVEELSLKIPRILHGTQEFEYLGMVHAGDRITVRSRIRDIYDKKNGALEFVVLENEYTNQRDELVVRSTNTLVYKNA